MPSPKDPGPARPELPPLPNRDREAVVTGIVIWAVLGVVALVGYPWLNRHGHGWLVWTPPVADLLGLYGLRYLRRRTS